MKPTTGYLLGMKAFVAAGNEFGFADPEFKVATTSRIVESAKIDLTEDIPTLELTKAELGEGIGLLNLMVKAGLCGSNSDARRLIKGGACSIDDAKISDEKMTITADAFAKGPITLKAGKKNRKRVKLL